MSTPASRAKVLLLGLVATLVGALQVATTVAGWAETHLLTLIGTLRLIFCGSLLVVGILVLVAIGREHKDRR